MSSLNRYSMPVTRRGNPLYDNIDQTNAAGFLFRDDESMLDSNYNGLKNVGDDGFPKMIAQKGNANRVSYFQPSTVHLTWPLTHLALHITASVD